MEAHRVAVEVIHSALKTLATSRLWVELLRENVYCASYEGFVQTSLLGAINSQQAKRTLWCDRERRVRVNGKVIAPDLWLVNAEVDAWNLWEEAKAHPVKARLNPMLQVAKGAVEIKVAWTKDWAGGSAVISQRAKEIAKTITKLRVSGSHRWNHLPRFVLAVFGGVSESPGALVSELADAEFTVREKVLSIAKSKAVRLGKTESFRLLPATAIARDEHVGCTAVLFDARWHNEVS
jgi:hypothetical protein